MKRKLFFISLFLICATVTAQRNTEYLKANAVRIDNPNQLSDSVYHLLSKFQLFMVGEMHGTNECAIFTTGLAKLLTSKGDSVLVGLEIQPEQIGPFLLSNTDSSIYQSPFFSTYTELDGRQSFAWASVISHLKSNRRIQLFFFDRNANEGKIYERDSIMYLKIKAQMQSHPNWKIVTLSGNAHASFTKDDKKAATYLRQDKELSISEKICTIYNYYQEGSCMGSFSDGFQKKDLSRPPNDFDTTFSFDKYIVLLSPKTTFPYTAIYYTKNITVSWMVKDNLNLKALKADLKAIYDRDQKTRKVADSAAFMGYIDSCNQAQVKVLIAKYGWMGRSMIGNYSTALFAVIQHADLAIQEEYFPLLQESVDEGESWAYDMAMMQDRILMRRGKKQIYGSQVVFDKDGRQIFYPIEDEINVNIRREKVGLPPMEEYAKYFGIPYKLPATKTE